jgi:hypothetical protein
MKFTLAAFFLLALFSNGFAQKAEATISLNEAFFDAALDALFVSGVPLEFPIAENGAGRRSMEFPNVTFAKAFSEPSRVGGSTHACAETIKIQRELNGVRTAVRFREGKILAPLAFSGNYDPPFVGCVAFSGWAESSIDLEFDQNAQRLVARVRVLNVNLNGSGGIGGSVVAKLVQGSIDKKINPVELFQINKLSFAIPVKGSGAIQMRATGIRHELQNGAINVVVSYEFGK